jgi:dnaB-like helicase N terminal domain|nr:MAG TPA: Helicase, ATPase, REPLICATION [Caudoviricetes sp.]
MEDRVPLNDKACEDVLVGSILADNNAFNSVRDILSDDCFFDNFNKAVYRAIIAVTEQGYVADIISVKAELESKRVQFDIMALMSLTDHYTINIRQYAIRLKDLATRRRLTQIAQRLLINSYTEENPIEQVTQQATDDIAALFSSDVSEVMVLRDGIKKVNTIINQNLQDTHQLTGSPTGFEELDKKMGGLQCSDLTIIAAESSIGKSSLSLSIALNAAKYGEKIAIYSMEMKAEQLTARIMAMESGVSSSNILYARLDGGQLQQIEKGVGKIENLNIFFDDRSTSSIDTILSSIRYMVMKYKVKGAIIDYLQILNVNMKNVNKEQAMGDVARRLKNIAKELDIWVIALSQLSRDKENPIPTLARLRDSGQIAEAADNVILIYRPEFYGKLSYPSDFASASVQGTALIHLAKGRNIGTTKFICGFSAPTTLFYNLQNVPTKSEQQNITPLESVPF